MGYGRPPGMKVGRPDADPGEAVQLPMARLKRTTARRSLTGLDIEPGGIRAVEVAVIPGGPLVVERAAEAPLPPGVVRDGEVVDSDTLAGALRTMFAEHKLDRRVRIG